MAARKKKRSSKASSTRKKSTKRPVKRKSAARKKTANSVQLGMSLDRKLDIAGVITAAAGLLTIIALASGSESGLGALWVGFLQRWLGWGIYILPVGLVFAGLWLALRKAERVPAFVVERVVGLLLLFLNLLAWLHALSFPADTAEAYALAESGGGGGLIGAWLLVLLENGLGVWGAGIALFGWLLIAAALSLDVSILELFRWVGPMVLRLQDAWDERRARQNELQPTLPFSPPPEAPPPVMEASPAVKSAGMKEVPVDGQLPTEGHLQDTQPLVVWELPVVGEMLAESQEPPVSKEHDQQRARVIEETLASFGAPAQVVEINRGPTITQFGVEPAFVETRSGRTRVRVGKIAALADDLSLALAASRIRIQAPVPGKGFVGIEVPNEEIASVALRGVFENDSFQRLRSPLRFALGQDVAGKAISADLASMPHLLIAGATGSGKSVCVNALISCLLLNNTPETLRLIMIDPKRVELTGYNGIPHLFAPVVVELERVVGVLQWVTREMDSRYQKFADMGARNISDYNQRVAANAGKPLPYLVVVIDELADLMMVAPDQSERLITRMAQLARATGIHLVISTQRPSVDVVTGLIKANIPARVSFAVASGTDSRVILDQPGAERLLGQGDMLFQAPDAPAPVRLQGVFVSDDEIHRLVQYWRQFAGSTTTAPVATGTPPPDAPPSDLPLKQLGFDEMEEQEPKDKLYDEAVDLIRRQGRASISMLQRRLRIGYTRAARMIEAMEAEGIIGPAQKGAQTRVVLDYGPAAPPVGE